MNPFIRFARRSLPRTEGVLSLACLDAPVEVIRDRFGIPHIYAGSRLDLARAQGYVHAQDRLFQMESLRRFAFGRLSEIAGRRTLELDRLARRLRLRRAAEQDAAACDPETAAVASAYCEGVNAFIATGPLPFELRLARVRLDPWTPVDVQVPAQTFGLALCGNWESELARERIRARLGDQALRRLEPEYPGNHPTIVPQALAERGGRLRSLLRERLGMGASNCLALAGSRTEGGAPILAGDPHLLLGIPAIWHAQHVVWDGGECAGFTVPGAPVVILGRNRRVAWGMTTAMIDTQDLFVERLHPDDPTRYEVDGEWLEGEVVREEIRVRGRRAPVVEEIVVTRHGPVVVPPEPGGHEALALRWSHHEPAETSRSLLDLMTAESVEEADAALVRFAGPPHNLTLADADGAIMYRLAGGPIPRRRSGDGRLPSAGWDSAEDWDGYLEDAELPRLRDPEDGVLVTANNKVAPDGLAPPGEYLSGYRASRIRSLVDEGEYLSPADCEAILLDCHSLPGLELAAIARRLSSDEPLEERALDLLRGWDGDLRVESPGGAVYGALMAALEREAFAAASGSAEADLPAGVYERGRPTILRLLAEGDDSFFDGRATWDEVVRRSLTAAVSELGPDPAVWRRGRLHQFRLAHPLEGLPGLRRLLSRGPFPVGGDADTVRVMATVGGLAEGSMIGASMRAVFDLGDPDGNRIALCPGQSGHPASPHYDDLLPGWLAGEYFQLAMERETVESLAESRLTLRPE